MVKQPEEILRKIGIKNSLKKKDSLDLVSLLLDQTDLRFLQPSIFGFSYYVIVNNNHDVPYGAIGLLTEKTITKTKTFDLLEQKPVHIVKVDDDIDVREDDLTREIKQKIYLPQKPVAKRNKFKIWPFRSSYGGQTTVQINLTDKMQKPAETISAYGTTVTGRPNLGEEYIYPSFLSRPGAVDLCLIEMEKYFNEGNSERMEDIFELLSLIEDIHFTNDLRLKRKMIKDYFAKRFGPVKENLQETKTENPQEENTQGDK